MPRAAARRPSPPPVARPESYRSETLVILLRLHWFIRLRWVFVAAALGALAIERYAFPAAKRPWQLLASVLGVGAINLAWTIVSRLLQKQLGTADVREDVATRSGQVFANAQVAGDLLLLTTILHYSGGVENPMSVFYLFHVAIGSLLLRARQAFVQCGWAVVLYALLVLAEWRGWIEHYPLLPQLGSPQLYQRLEFVALAVVVQACAMFGVLYFTLHIARLLDQHEAELLRTNAALAQSRQAIGDLQKRRARFMQTAAHQLKSPLAIVQTLASLIRDRVVTDEPGILATCEKISRRAQEGIEQVTELLTLARVQEADPARHRASVADVREIVTELCRRYRPLAERKGLTLTEWLPPSVELTVSVEPHDLRDCLSNLIDNAIKYTPGPGKVRVAVTVKRVDGRPTAISIHVSDTGIGLDPALLPSAGRQLGEQPLFDAFRRGANVIAAGVPGTGLGLSIVRELVEQAGGRIWVMSRPGAGTSFTVTFPARGTGPEPPLVPDTRAAEVVLESPTPQQQP